ncbi:NUDIX domain-containing protein [Sphingomonas gilva]|uniref:NUDIX domain-containing protein n=1 Tax=Sphingomonas gilva TaxID=2305907 RepID=A0A396RTX2_9SPHN|nr:NUDIX domain-containing protein [Sphingomonas gilva]RHW18882.1 NUDIX domain-containing protein [Sphingomonas gilva]
MSEPIPAATTVLFRDRADGPPELLMVERAATMAFAGGAMVFPGGRIDPGDRRLAELHAPDIEDAAARIAAIRETLEEAGIAVGLDPLPSIDQCRAMRGRLHDGEAMSAVLGDHRLALGELVPFARWLPAHAHMRIFDTLFYIAAAPPGSSEPVVDATENVAARWTTAADLLAEADRGEARIIFPTRRNLERLARYASFADAVADARAHPVRAITPYAEEREGGMHLCIPDDLGYPVTSELMTGALRG